MQAPSARRVLPANPLSDFTDDTLSAFVDAAVAEVHDPLVAIAAHVERSAQTRIGTAPTTTRRPAHAPHQSRPVPMRVMDEPTQRTPK
jgi:hypothetical protein